MPLGSWTPLGEPPREWIVENVRAVTPTGTIGPLTVGIAAGRIVAIGEAARGLGLGAVTAARGRVDARGGTLLPGLIDLHSDAIEREVCPRPGGRYSVELAVHELDRKLACCGITCVFHSLTVGGYDPHELRQVESAAEAARIVHRIAPQMGIRHRLHLRCEFTAPESRAAILRLVHSGLGEVCSLMDHSIGQGQYATIERLREFYRSEALTDAEIDAMAAQQLTNRATLESDDLAGLAQACHDRGLLLASHDDDSGEKVAAMADLGVHVSEFPVTLAAARAAHAAGMAVMMGAPNLLRGASLSGNLSAREAVAAGCCDLIASDHTPMSILHAVFLLDRLGLCPLHEAVNMASAGPAAALGQGDEVGAIEVGKRADLVLVDAAGAMPRVLWTLADGKTAYARF